MIITSIIIAYYNQIARKNKLIIPTINFGLYDKKVLALTLDGK